MKKRTLFIKHKGRELIFLDYSNIKNKEEYKKAIQETDKIIFSHKIEPNNSLTLIDVTNSIMCVEVISESSKLYAKIGSKNLLVAIVGVSSELQRVMINAFSDNFYLANSMEQAKNWLVEQAKKREKKNES